MSLPSLSSGSAPSPTSSSLVRVARPAALLIAIMLLAGCGGGGGSGSNTSTAQQTTPQTEAALAALCASPRTGTDPYTKVAYPDRQGSLLDEQDWLAAWTRDLYLWYSDVTYPSPSGYATAIDYFDVLKTTAVTASGAAKDRFHFTYPTSQWESMSQVGVSPGYGIGWDIVVAAPPRQLVVAYLEPNLPSGVSAPNVVRGTQVISIDGALVSTGSADVLNAGLSPATVGESHVFVVQDPGATTQRSLTLTSSNITETPVQNVQTLVGGTVGYMLFNDHLATAEQALITAVNQLATAGVSDLVLDIRYNGGGYLDIASELAYMIAGPARTTGKTFELTQFNDQHPTVDPVTQQTITPVLFHSTALGFSATAGTALPTLNLGRVFVLTGAGTCSASEAVINSLNGVGVQVIQVGSTTCGKPYGFYPQDNCGTTYFSIEFQGVNALGFGGYPDGFAPQNGNTSGLLSAAILPGCSVADDFSHALGDPSEARLAAALAYRTSSTCPIASGLAAAPSRTLAIEHTGLVIKSPFSTNRVLKH